MSSSRGVGWRSFVPAAGVSTSVAAASSSGSGLSKGIRYSPKKAPPKRGVEKPRGVITSRAVTPSKFDKSSAETRYQAVLRVGKRGEALYFLRQNEVVAPHL